jgi:CBS domain containing-hemolysin-like protein
MSQYELELVQRALQFTDCKVRNVLTPAKQVRMLDVRETLGPVLLDELHATGFTHFPVYDGKKTNIVGILTLRGGAASHQAGRVSDVCDKHVAFVHEEDTLAEALQAYHATKHHLFVVIDRFSGYVGIMTVGDIVHQLVGAMEAAPFSQHEDREAVAGKHEAPEPTPPEVTDDSQTSEKVFENTPEVVE